MDSTHDADQAYAKEYGQVVAKAWADDDFKQRLLANPVAVLQEEGIPVPAGLDIEMVENTDKVVYLTLPSKPNEELSDEQLDQVAGGSTASTAGTMGTLSSLCSTISTGGSVGSAGTAG